MPVVANLSVFTYLSSGQIIAPPSGTNNFYALNNFSNVIFFDIEDGGSEDSILTINFTPNNQNITYTSHWFYMQPIGFIEKVVNNEESPRTFYRYSIQVPKQVLTNNQKNVGVVNEITVRQRFGFNYKGFVSLVEDLPNTNLETRYNEKETYYVLNEGFYQVIDNAGVYEWADVDDSIDLLSMVKQYSVGEIYVQKGYSNPLGVAPVTVTNTEYIMSILAQMQIKYNTVEEALGDHVGDLNNPHNVRAFQIPFDNSGTNLVSTMVENVIKEINTKANINTQDILDMKNGTDAFTEVAIGVEPNVAKIRYIHTNGNNYQVLQIEYPDGRKEEINETIPVNYRNESGVTLSSGRLLMTDGTSQGNQAVKGILFDPTSPNAYKILGVVTVDGVSVNQKSKATRFGIVHDIPTSEFATSGTAYAEGQYLWGVANGRLSNVAPTKPALRVQVGIIINLQGGKADVLVAPVIYQKLSDSSDVRIGINESGSMLVNGDILRYQTSTQTWANSNALVLVEIEINNIKNGTTIVKKAEQDKNGNDIVNTYETKVIVSGINSRVTNLESRKLNKDFTSLIEEASLSLSDLFVVDKGSGARKVSLGTLASYLSTQELELFTIVEELPTENQNPNTIYLLVTENEDGENQLLEYIWIADQERWELIGSLEVDLSNYYTKTEVNGLLEDKVDKIAGKGLSTNDYTNTDKQNVEKIPTIEQDILDLESDKVDKNNAITAGTKTKITYDAKGLVTGGADLVATDIPNLAISKTIGLQGTLDSKVDKNADIVGATKPKITYDSKGLVTGGSDLVASDIPQLAPSKITQDANNRFVTDNEKSTWNGKQDALTAGDGISISGNVISAVGGITIETWNTSTKTLALSDSNKLFVSGITQNQTLTIPSNDYVAFPIGTMITFLSLNSNTITFSGPDVSLSSMDDLVELKTQYAMASLIKIATNTWQLVGALE